MARTFKVTVTDEDGVIIDTTEIVVRNDKEDRLAIISSEVTQWGYGELVIGLGITKEQKPDPTYADVVKDAKDKLEKMFK